MLQPARGRVSSPGLTLSLSALSNRASSVVACRGGARPVLPNVVVGEGKGWFSSAHDLGVNSPTCHRWGGTSGRQALPCLYPPGLLTCHPQPQLQGHPYCTAQERCKLDLLSVVASEGQDQLSLSHDSKASSSAYCRFQGVRQGWGTPLPHQVLFFFFSSNGYCDKVNRY